MPYINEEFSRGVRGAAFLKGAPWLDILIAFIYNAYKVELK